jgi:hypothetical protein
MRRDFDTMKLLSTAWNSAPRPISPKIREPQCFRGNQGFLHLVLINDDRWIHGCHPETVERHERANSKPRPPNRIPAVLPFVGQRRSITVEIPDTMMRYAMKLMVPRSENDDLVDRVE